jgi:trimeric autotransporter adhesin
VAVVVSSSGVIRALSNDRALQPVVGCYQSGSRMYKKLSVSFSRILNLACCAVVAATLAACGGGGSDSATSTPAATNSTTSAATQPFIVDGVPPGSVRAGAKYQYIPSASNADGRTLSYSITNKPDWATFGETNGELSGVPDTDDVGTTAAIQIAVSDGTSRATVGPFRITVIPSTPSVTSKPSAAPLISGTPPASITAGQTFSFTPVVIASSGDSLSFSIVNLPAWATFNTGTGALVGTPTSANVGTFANILISVADGATTVSLPAFSVQVVAAASNAPTISGTPATTVIAGTQYSFTPLGADPQGNTVTFSIANAPPWASFSSATGQLTGTPPTADVGTDPNIVISVSDGTLSASLAPFSIQVQAISNNTPQISGTPPASVVTGNTYAFTPSASDPAGGVLTFSIQGMPSWATFAASSGELSGTPTSANVGTFAGIIISVSDGTESVALPAFSIQVNAPADQAPVISGRPPASVIAGSNFMFKPTASDPQGNALIFSVTNLPPWANFSSTTGQLSGTPAKSYIGTFSNIVIRVSDGIASTALPAFSIKVDAPADQAPVISGSPSTSVVAGSAYSFVPSVSDPSGNPLTLSVTNLPSWASFSSITGQLSGTPTTANVGTFSNIVISVTDGTLSASLAAFNISVSSPANPPPTISGTPATSVSAGAAYSFTPTTTDPSGDALTFSVQNLPGWATFNAQTGMLSGTPGAGDVGSDANIIISVSDGTSSASLAAFTLSVTQAASGNATLTWSAPTQNTNGTPLTNLAGFHIYYGTSADNLNQSVQIANPALTSYVLSNLPSGTWYFSINDYTSAGVESAISNVASMTIP